MSAGGYHLHIGCNTWRVPFPPRLEEASGGLGYYTIVVPDRRELERTAARLKNQGVTVDHREDALDLGGPSGIRVLVKTA